jgi:hypothetical protein
MFEANKKIYQSGTAKLRHKQKVQSKIAKLPNVLPNVKSFDGNGGLLTLRAPRPYQQFGRH